MQKINYKVLLLSLLLLSSTYLLLTSKLPFRSAAWMHYIGFSVLGFALFNIEEKYKKASRLILYTLALTEVIQPYFGRAFELKDFVFNALGVLTAFIIYKVIKKKHEQNIYTIIFTYFNR